MNATISEFTSLAGRALTPYLDCVGLLIYSPAATLRADNPVMYWGYNPGQDPCIKDETHWTIREALEKFPGQMSLIEEQSWPKPRRERSTVTGEEKYSCRYLKGDAPYQRGIRGLLLFIGHDAALVANFLFVQTRRQHRLHPTREEVDCCWQVHKFLLEKTQARVLITTAGVISALRRFELMNLGVPIEWCSSGYSNWRCELYKKVDGFPTIIAAPHMSYWGNCGKGNTIVTKYSPALRWIKERVDRLTH